MTALEPAPESVDPAVAPPPLAAGAAPEDFSFATDAASSVHPAVMAAIGAANDGPAAPYGIDPYSRAVSVRLSEALWSAYGRTSFVFNGTAANSLALASCCQSYHSVVCHEHAHIETDECGAPEFFSNGTKLLLASGQDGKLSPDAVEALVRKRSDIHYPKPRVVSLTQSTELGTVYSLAEVRALCQRADALNLRVHMDGARFANAVASLKCTPADLTWRAGVDVLCFGGSKNGMSGGEAVIFFDRGLSEEFAYRCKQAGQLASKMRFLSCQWVGMLKDGAWLTRAAHANAMASLLEQKLATVPGVRILYPVQANAVFAQLSPELHTRLAGQGWELYTFIGGGTRFMCSWDTSEDDINQLVADIRGSAHSASPG